ncbi:head GIN domain-containing protein [Rufibacter roseus]|uniref:Head GIN domain-containing protein n=1 Tax=Rufibacter roseus TaxID=1567108 RepID=A0ABW2DJ17_9BACT|nr:head GIN domain-containing protein [Rufibacter roseus]
MKNLNILTLLAFVAVLVSLSSFRTTALAQEEARNLPSFNGIGLAYPAQVILRQGNTQSVRLEGDAEQLAQIETEVKDGQLNIRNKERNWNRTSNNKERVTIYVTVPSIERLAVSGSGRIKSESTFKATSLDLAVSGSGSIQLTANVDKVSSRISGSGSIDLKGSGKQSTAAVSGSGSVRSFDFKADEAKVSISGSGKCEVSAKNNLKTSISGSGKVYYAGSPTVDSRVSGSGSVQKRG